MQDTWGLDLHRLLIAMRNRSASNPVDQVGGLLYFCMHEPEIPWLAQPLPTYHPAEGAETAWARSVHAYAQVPVYTNKCLNSRCQVRNAIPRPDNHFATQLLELFPYPSAQHWFPSWTQVRSYPDMISQEAQWEGKPEAKYELRLYGGKLYRGITLRNGTAGAFTASNDAGQSIILQLHQTRDPRSQRAIIEFDPAERYVLINLAPFNQLERLYSVLEKMSHENPLWDTANVGLREYSWRHSLVVCKELADWKPPRTQWDPRLRRKHCMTRVPTTISFVVS